MSYSLQTSFYSVMKDWPDKYHVWGTPRGHLQGQTQGHMSYHTLFEGIYFALSRSTHIWNAYVAENLLKSKKREKWSMAITKIRHV